MPLTLQCYCTDQVTICQLSELWLDSAFFYSQTGPVSASLGFGFNVSGSTLVGYSNPANVLHSESLPLSIADPDVWETLSATVEVGSSLNQPPSSAPALWSFGFAIRAVYACIDLETGEVVKDKEIFSAPFGDGCECFDGIRRVLIETNTDIWRGEDGDLNVEAGGIARMWTSSALGACQTCVAEFSSFLAPPKPSFIDVTASRGPLCLCAEGGTPPYAYYVLSGRLPDGLTLNPSTGCLEGKATGPGSGPVEFLVIDSAGEEATATCDFAAACVAPIAISNWMY